MPHFVGILTINFEKDLMTFEFVCYLIFSVVVVVVKVKKCEEYIDDGLLRLSGMAS